MRVLLFLAILVVIGIVVYALRFFDKPENWH